MYNCYLLLQSKVVVVIFININICKKKIIIGCCCIIKYVRVQAGAVFFILKQFFSSWIKYASALFNYFLLLHVFLYNIY